MRVPWAQFIAPYAPQRVVRCQASLNTFWTSVILSAAKNLLVRGEILRCTQNDNQQGVMVRGEILRCTQNDNQQGVMVRGEILRCTQNDRPAWFNEI